MGVHLYPVLQPLVKALIKPIWRPTVSGLVNIPATGPVILASNHQAAAETYFVPCMITREVHWLGKNGLFNGRGLPGKFFAWLMASVNVIPVDRSGDGRANGALKAGIDVLEDGHLLGVFPEGTRSPDGRLYKGKTGAVRLALATGAPIIPVAVLGAFEAQVDGSVLPRLGRPMHTRIGEALNMRALLEHVRAGGVLEGAIDAAVNPAVSASPDAPETAATKEELRILTLALMGAIQDLSGQEYVDEFAADVKKRLREAQASSAPTPA